MINAAFDNRNLNEKIYYFLRNKIVNNELTPGTRIDYNEIANELGVSKTPVRDALQLLSQDGLVDVKSRSGTFVSQPNVKDIEEIYEVRKALERQAIKLSMTKMPRQILEKIYQNVLDVDNDIDTGDLNSFFQSDRNLHKTLITYSGNSRLIKMMESLEAQISWIGVMIAHSQERPRQANSEHKEILNALLQSDVLLAQNLMEEHIETIKQMTLKDFR
ncbi:HTH-type transcriptional repressor RspR [Neobacillus rhizosphaerae]|uniref:HTH-type transcriptional repressor RspR n=1 Tax=Neobacillus rhizosphaerae TaxID=2880965 RepID=A0ABM9ESM1_9BACI|nr:GntR family transcriptional regulator [Neobacillus rhizosphaerae]CAH2715173.1 HTH-type transcriptional repressor RspR [Neobacillus rhizosphaerae]